MSIGVVEMRVKSKVIGRKCGFFIREYKKGKFFSEEVIANLRPEA